VKPIKKPCFWGDFFEKIQKKTCKSHNPKKSLQTKKTLGEKLLITKHMDQLL
jgi:hypothetical protein